MKISFRKAANKGFSLFEVVIAIGVLAVLLSGFLVVFAPAAAGIRKSLNSQDAGRLVTTLEQELVTLRGTEAQDLGLGPEDISTGFDKAFYYIRRSSGPAVDADDALLIYKYRASLTDDLRPDKTPVPVEDIKGLVAGRDYVVQNMVRRRGDFNFEDDLLASEGPIYLVKCNQLILQKDPATGQKRLMLGTEGEICNVVVSGANETITPVFIPDDYSHAVITFKADFYDLPTKQPDYFDSAEFENLVTGSVKPVFSRNLAVRR